MNVALIIKEKLWPVEQSELEKVLLLSIIKFCATFVYSILFVCKDTIIITSPGLGTELIPVLKGTVMILAAFSVSALYSRLTASFSFQIVFSFFLFCFVSFFIAYGLYLYPHREGLALSEEAMGSIVQYLGFLHGHWLAVIKYWFHSLFFMTAELWGGVVILTLFWGLANTINSVEEASRFYTLFSAGGHLATLISGFVIGYITSSSLTYENSLQTLMAMCIGFCLVIQFAVYRIHKKYDLRSYKPKSKVKVSFVQSLQSLWQSKYLLAICLMVVGFSFTMNMVEVFWKDFMRTLFKSSSEFQFLLSSHISLIGFLSLVLSIFFSGNIIRSWGWKKSALMTPVCVAVVALCFFLFYFYTRTGADVSPKLLIITVFIGAAHNILAKILKYSMFDPVKEMAYIPLTYKEKVNGKAAVEIISSRLGKSGSSWLQLLAMELLATSYLSDTSAYLFPSIVFGFVAWIVAVHHIGHKLD